LAPGWIFYLKQWPQSVDRMMESTVRLNIPQSMHACGLHMPELMDWLAARTEADISPFNLPK